jgi:polysaccharide pyruvyl transferase WcaK-like protein
MRPSMHILLDTALNDGAAEYDNMGDISMLQVAVKRLLKMWPSASIEVLTESPEKLAKYCPGTSPVSRVGRDLWLRDNLLLGKYHKYLPKFISSRSSELRRELWLRWPALLRLMIRLRLGFRDRNNVRNDLMAFLEAMGNADLFIVCGSGGFADGTRNWDIPILGMLEIAIRRHIPTAILGQGMGPLNDPEVLSRAKRILPAVDIITLRGSRGGLTLLESLGVAISNVQTTGDEAIELAYEARSENFGHGLGINLRVASYSKVDKHVIEIIRPILQEFARRHNAPMIPVPIAFHPWAYDHKTIQQLMIGFDDHSDGGLTLDTPLKIIEQIGHCRIVVTGAYHAAVFALAQGIPVVCLSKSPYYDAKFLGLEDQFGVGCETIFLNDPNAYEKIADAMERAWYSAEKVHLPLQQAALRQIELSRSAYERMRNLVNSRRNEI